ncbi:MAG: hypothetical protein QM487_09900 [Candidatus Marithrix sp.]
MDSQTPIENKKKYDVDVKEFEEHLRSIVKKQVDLSQVTKELGCAGKNGHLELMVKDEATGETVTKRFAEANLRAAQSELSRDILELRKFFVEAKKKKRKPRDTTQQELLTGTYTPLYADDVLQNFLNQAGDSQVSGFGDIHPLKVGTKSYKPDLLINKLQTAKDGYMIRNTLTLLFYIYLYVNKLQNNEKKSIIASNNHMDQVFGGLIAGHYTGFYYMDSSNKRQPFQKDQAYMIAKEIRTIEDKDLIAKKMALYEDAKRAVSNATERHEKMGTDTTKSRLASAECRLEKAADVYNTLVEKYNALIEEAPKALEESGRTEAIPKFVPYTQEITEEDAQKFEHYKHAMTKLKGAARDKYIAEHEAVDFSTYGITKNSYPNFDEKNMDIFMLQKITGLNYDTLARLENEDEKFDKINSGECREMMTEDHNLVQEVNNEWWDLIHIFNLPQDEQKLEPRSIVGKEMKLNMAKA